MPSLTIILDNLWPDIAEQLCASSSEKLKRCSTNLAHTIGYDEAELVMFGEL